MALDQVKPGNAVPDDINVIVEIPRDGDAVKYDTTVNEINRAGSAIFLFKRDSFPNEAITSERAQLVYDRLKLNSGKRLLATRISGERYCPPVSSHETQNSTHRE